MIGDLVTDPALIAQLNAKKAQVSAAIHPFSDPLSIGVVPLPSAPGKIVTDPVWIDKLNAMKAAQDGGMAQPVRPTGTPEQPLAAPRITDPAVIADRQA